MNLTATVNVILYDRAAKMKMRNLPMMDITAT